MGGMFTILKVREGITSYAGPGLVQEPAAGPCAKAGRASRALEVTRRYSRSA